MDADELVEELNDLLSGALEDDAFDIALNEDDGTIEIATDEWTLVLESWPAGIGYLAMDDEPDTSDPAELQTVMTTLIGPALRPLVTINASSDGLLAAALNRTTDPLSNALAGLLLHQQE